MTSLVSLIMAASLAVEPAPYFAPGIAFDAGRGRLVVFGGEGEGRSYSGDTWEFDGSRWSRTATSGPTPRVWGALAYDTKRRRTVLFGGNDATGALGDTWEYDGAAWTRRSTTGPAPRYAHELVYDARRERVVMFGGRGASAYDDLWEWDGVQWTQVPTPTRPGARFTHALAFDGSRDAMALFGGYGRAREATGDASLGDFWTKGAGGWASQSFEGPPARDHVSMAFDVARGRLVLFGGGGGGGPTPRTTYSDTWEFDGRAWRRKASSGPGITGNHRIVYDASRRRVVLWTGVEGSKVRTELWEWDGARWSSRWRSAATNESGRT